MSELSPAPRKSRGRLTLAERAELVARIEERSRAEKRSLRSVIAEFGLSDRDPVPPSERFLEGLGFNANPRGANTWLAISSTTA